MRNDLMHLSKPRDLIIFTKPYDSMLLQMIMIDLILWITNIDRLERVKVAMMDLISQMVISRKGADDLKDYPCLQH